MRTVINKNFLVCVSCLFSVLLFGCLAGNNNMIKRYIVSSHCKASCWLEIEPETTTKGQVLEILTKHYGAENVSVDGASSENWLVNWKSTGTDLSDHGMVEGFQDKTLRVWVFLPDNQLKVQDLITEIGNPSSVSTVTASINGGEGTCAASSLLYPQSGVEFYLSSTAESAGVKSDQFVIGMRIIAPWNTDEQISSDSSYHLWDGYREYCPKTPK